MDSVGLNWADWVLLGLIGLSALIGIWRGFLGEVLSLLVWIAAFMVAFAFGDRAATQFGQAIEVESLRLIIAYVLLFVVTLLIGGMLNWLIGRAVRKTGLSGTDRFLGLGFGLLRGVALGVLLVLTAGFTPFPADEWWHQSRLIPSFQRGAELLAARLPENVHDYLDYGRDAVQHLAPAGIEPVEASSEAQ